MERVQRRGGGVADVFIFIFERDRQGFDSDGILQTPERFGGGLPDVPSLAIGKGFDQTLNLAPFLHPFHIGWADKEHVSLSSHGSRSCPMVSLRSRRRENHPSRRRGMSFKTE